MPLKRKRNDMDSDSSSSESGSDSDNDESGSPVPPPPHAPEPLEPVEELWTVQRITGHRGSGVLLEYLIVWDGDWPMDWNSVYNCDCEDAIADYWSSKSKADYNRAHEIKATPKKSPRKSATPAQPRPRAATSAATPVASGSKDSPAPPNLTPTSLKVKLTFAPAPPGASKPSARTVSPMVQPPKKRGRMSKVDKDAEALKVRMGELDIARRSSAETEHGNGNGRAIEVGAPAVAKAVVAKPSLVPAAAVLDFRSEPAEKEPSSAPAQRTKTAAAAAMPLSDPGSGPSAESTVQPSRAPLARAPVHTPAAYSTTTGSSSLPCAPNPLTSRIAINLMSVDRASPLSNTPALVAPPAAISAQQPAANTFSRQKSAPPNPGAISTIVPLPSPVATDRSLLALPATVNKSPASCSSLPKSLDEDSTRTVGSAGADPAPLAAEPVLASPRAAHHRTSELVVNEAAIGNAEYALEGKHLYQGMERVWSDPVFEWEDLVHTIHALCKESDVVHACIIWNDQSYSWVPRDILRHRAPQKLIQFFERHTVLAQ